MNAEIKPQNKIIGCTCALCGESLTAPIVFKGKTYGWTCITKINPSAKKLKKKPVFQNCEFLKRVDNPNGSYWFVVLYGGRKYHSLSICKNDFPKEIIESNGNYFIDVSAYKNARLYYNRTSGDFLPNNY